MELFKNIRLKIGDVILKRKTALSKKNVVFTSFSKVKSIGIVWDASKSEEFACLAKFHQKMLERKIEVKILGYFPGNNLPDRYTAIRYLICFRKNELNLFLHPNTDDAKTFINNPFDVLIDINFEKQFPLRCITSLSRSMLKVGLYDPEAKDHPFNLMIEMKRPVDSESYLNQVIKYLEMIKNEKLITPTISKPNEKI